MSPVTNTSPACISTLFISKILARILICPVRMGKQIRPSKSGRLEIFELLGEGSSGAVYRAIRADASQTIIHEVAIKILNSKNLVAEWAAEFASLCQVNSSRCVRVFGYEWIEDRPALILEFIQGATLEELTRNFCLTLDELAHLFVEARQGLVDLRRFNICHGDISATNIMVDLNGQVRLLDYGLANTRPGQVRLTPKYAAPEVLNGCPANLASDIWSLAAVLKYLCRDKSLHKFSNFLQELCLAEKDLRPDWPLPTYDENLARERLTAKVNDLIERRSREKSMTHALVPANDKAANSRAGLFNSWQVPVAFAALLFAFQLGGSDLLLERLGAQDHSSLRFRSNFAIEVVFDQSAAQNIPFDLPSVMPGRHRVSWRGPRGAGERVLTLQPGEHKVIDDSFFGLSTKGAGRELLGCDHSRCGSGAD